jgi:hypothetical protein
VYRAGFAVAVSIPVRLPGFSELERRTAAEALPVAVAPTETEPAAPPAGFEEIPFEDASLDTGAQSELADEGGPQEALAEPLVVEAGENTDEPVSMPGEADEAPFEQASVETAEGPDIADAEGPAESSVDAIEDSLASPSIAPAPEHFVAETHGEVEPSDESNSADGGAFEDGPAVNNADGDKPEEA